MIEDNSNIKQYKDEILENIYRKRSEEVYVLKNEDELKIAQRDKTRCQDALLCFLKENLSPTNYETAFDYINALSEKENAMCGVWNKRFYFTGLKDGVKMF